MNRRAMIRKSAWLVAAAASPDAWPLPVPQFQLGACDWSVGKSLNPEAFDRAKQIGLQGIQVSYNTSKNPDGLSVADTLQSIKAAAERTGVKVSSLAIGELNRVPYKSAEIAEQWVWNSVDAAAGLGVKVVCLLFSPTETFEMMKRVRKRL
ncbi:hypothetical protein LXM26_28480 [Dyadobacter sp. LJ419]|uniref:Sugar phosphate isomerase/epimerase n=1 Tax=Dyadobacter chenwenxiniae TaxID=2906456 RepID=A0A9X1TGE9_9BACT|nr:hypothetical protein [Dyadobacter chenwenxiniae]MCF0065486.1 hypothetical protein [Dyadobacter chenwenxiniae]